MSRRLALAASAMILALPGCGNDFGATPAGTSEASLPPAATEFLVVTDDQLPVDGEPVDGDSDYQLTTPAGTLTLTMTGTLTSVPAGLAELVPGGSGTGSTPSGGSSALRPADGHRFLAAEFLVEADSGMGTSTIPPEVSLAVDRQTIGDLVGIYEEGRNEGTVVASVPEDAEAIELVVDFEGLTQTLDFQTGERISTNAGAYYDGANDRIDPTSANQIETTTTVPYTDFVGDPGECVITVTGSVATAYRVPWLEGYGWSPDDTTWIAVELSAFGTTDQCTDSSFFSPAETPEFFSMVTSTGEPLPLVTELDELLVFQVPEDELTVSLRVTVFGEVLGAVPDVIPVTVAPVDIALDFT